MKVRQVYKNYQTPKSLQEHMLRVASLARILLDNWTGIPLDKEAIIKACTLHDIAKPMTFDVAKQAAFGMSENDIEKLRQFQIEVKAKYGEIEHQATIGICKEVGCNENTVRLVDNLEWKYIPRLLQEKDFASLIPVYCDMRIGPKGILPLQVRLEELKKRVNGDDYEDNVKNGMLAEHKIVKNVRIDVNTITTSKLDQDFENLLNTELYMPKRTKH